MNLLQISQNELRDFYAVLDHANIINYDEEEHNSQFELKYSMSGDDLFVSLKNFLKTKENINRFFVDCDFTILD